MKRSTLATDPVVQFHTYEMKGGAMRRFALAALAAATIVLVFSGIASAKATTATRATYGQCGPAVHSGSGLVNAWGAMGVLNTPAASKIAKSAGWKPMDGGMVSFLVQRGREFKLAQPANIEDFGCRYGSMYSVGMRHYGAGEHVIAIVPSKYNPAQISSTPRKGYHKVSIWVHTVGRGNCANGFSKLVLVTAYVPNHAVAAPKKPKKSPPKPVLCSAGTVKNAAGNCVVQSNQAEQNCKAQGGNYNGNNGLCTIVQVVGNCSNIVVINGNGNTVSTSQQGNCNTTVTTPPCGCTPPPVCPAGTTGTPPNCVTPPPPMQAPTILSITTLNDVTTGQCRTGVEVMYSVPAGQSGTLTITAGPGVIKPQNVFQASAGQTTQSVTYCAPSEVPANGTDTITATIITQGGKDTKSSTFRILAPETPPKS